MTKYPLLQSQMGVFLECIQIPDSTQYNLPLMISLSSDVDLDRLTQAWDALVEAKHVFRNRYELTEDGTPVQWFDETMEVPLKRSACTKAELDVYLAQGFVRPFDVLSGEPLVRA